MATYSNWTDIKINEPQFQLMLDFGNSETGYFNKDDIGKDKSEQVGGTSLEFAVNIQATGSGVGYVFSIVQRPDYLKGAYLVTKQMNNTNQSLASVFEEPNGLMCRRACFYLSNPRYQEQIGNDQSGTLWHSGFFTAPVYLRFRYITMDDVIKEYQFYADVDIVRSRDSQMVDTSVNPNIIKWRGQPSNIMHQVNKVLGDWDSDPSGNYPAEQNQQTMEFTATIPIFTNLTDADTYLRSGTMTEPDEPEPDMRHFYIDCKNYSNTEPTFSGATYLSHHRQDFYWDEIGELAYMKRYYTADIKAPHNMEIDGNKATIDLYKDTIYMTEDDTTGSTTTTENMPMNVVNKHYNTGEEWRFNSDTKLWYCSVMSTNIQLVGSKNDPFLPPDPSNPTGDDENNTDMPDPTIQNGGGRVFILDSIQMASVRNRLYTTDEDARELIKKGLEMYGDNPVNFIVDCYATPINVKGFCNGSNTNIPFGAYISDVNGYEVQTNNTRVTIASVQIQGTYNDFRDYATNYYLYLPYYGFCKLDTEKYLSKVLKIDMAYDVWTGNIKYYLFSGGNMVEMFECSSKISQPLMSNSAYDNARNVIKSTESAVGNAVGISSNMASGNYGAIVSNATAYTDSLLDIDKSMHGGEKRLSGSLSSSINKFDPTYCYMIIEYPQFVKPDSMESEYGLPDNSINKIGSYHGYLQCTKPNLNVNCTSGELAEIESLLASGVYV